MFRSRYCDAGKIIFCPYNNLNAFKKPFIEPTTKRQHVKVNAFIFGVATIAQFSNHKTIVSYMLNKQVFFNLFKKCNFHTL